MPNTLVKRITFGLLCPILAILLILGLSLPAFGQDQPQVDLTGKNVLVLHAWEANLPMSTETNKALARVFSSGGIPAFNQSFECLDLRRNPGPEYKKLLAEKMRLQYGHRKPDLIIAVNPIAMRFATDDCRDLFADIPILALMLPTGFQVPKTSRRVISHFPSLDIVRTLDIALKLVPHAKRVYVACGSYETDIAFENQVRRVSKKWEGGLQFLYLSSMPFEDMLAVVSKAPPDSIVLTLGFARDVSGKLLTTPTAIRRLSEVSAAPVFGIADVALGYGIVGGFLSSYEFIGTKAGELVLDILRGTRAPENIPPVLDVPAVPMFDWRQLRHWDLNEDALPKGSIVINRQLTLWSLRYYILGVLAFLMLETALVIFLIVQKRRKNVAEESLKQKKEELDQFFNVTPDLLCIANTDGYFLRLNPAAERVLGYTREELMAKRFLDFVHPDDLNSTLKVITTLASQQKVLSFENRYRCKDGTYRWLEWSSVPAGNLIYAAARDVTERKRAEAETFQARRELLQLERLSRMGELTASLAHELNQPLTAILSNAQAGLRFIQSGNPDLTELREILQDISNDDKRAGSVIRSLRSMMKRSEVEKNPIILNNALNDVIQIFHTESIFRSVHVETDFDGSLPPVLGDKVQLQQVVLNLILNAADAMSDNRPEYRQIILCTRVKDDRIRVTVRDSGPGIDKGDLERIFEPFFTTKGTGLGMGLNICRTIVEAHGGRIWAENNPDKGATFFFELPVSSH